MAAPFGQRVTQFGSGLLGFGFKAYDDFRVLCSDIAGLAQVVDQVIELGLLELPVFVGNRRASAPAKAPIERAIRVRQLQFPSAVAGDNSLKLVNLVINR